MSELAPKTYDFNKIVNQDSLMWEVQKSGITTCLMEISVHGAYSFVTFKKELSTDEYQILCNLVAQHDASLLVDDLPAEVSVLEVPKYAVSLIDRTYIERSLLIETEADSVGPVSTFFTFKYPIVLLGGDLYLDPDMKGDSVKCVVHFAPNDIVGYCAAYAAAGSSYIEVNAAAIQEKYIWKTYELTAVNTSNGEHIPLGECIKIVGNKIYLDSPTPSDVDAGFYIKCVAVPIPVLHVTSTVGSIRIGDGTTRGAFMPEGSVLELIYTNNNKKAKKVSFMVEYYV